MIGILSDAHGNGQAFNKAILLLEKLGAERFYFLGDALGYIPNTNILKLIRSLGSKIHCIMGNHEQLILNKIFDTDREPVYQHKNIYNKLSDYDIEMIKDWSISIRLIFEVGKILFIHGNPNDETYGYMYPDTDLSEFKVPEKFVFMGHTHRPFLKQYDDTIYVNVGSCGIPRDHGTIGSAALFDEQTGKIEIIRFDIENQLKKAIEEAGRIHKSLLQLSNRKIDNFIGKFIQ
jgi:putative phosphoesterase